MKCSQLLFLRRQNLKLNNFKVSCESVRNNSQSYFQLKGAGDHEKLAADKRTGMAIGTK